MTKTGYTPAAFVSYAVTKLDPSPLWGGSAERRRCAASTGADAGVGLGPSTASGVATPTRLAQMNLGQPPSPQGGICPWLRLGFISKSPVLVRTGAGILASIAAASLLFTAP